MRKVLIVLALLAMAAVGGGAVYGLRVFDRPRVVDAGPTAPTLAASPAANAPPAAGIGTAGAPSVAGTAGAAGGEGATVRRANFGEWEYQCATLATKGREQCILIQNVQDQSGLNLAIVVLRVEDVSGTPTAGAEAPRKPVLRVIAPLGVLLPRGLGLKIDDVEIGATGFVRCIANGCVAEVEMDDTLLGQFRKGKLALFSVFLTPDEGRGLPLNLAGFDQGFAELR